MLTRNVGESIIIGDEIRIQIIRVSSNQARLGIKAPADVKVLREELADTPRSDSPPPDDQAG